MLIAIDTGGTKTLVADFSRTGKRGLEHRFPTPHDPEKYIARLLDLIDEQYGSKKIDGIVIGAPGVVKNNLILWCPHLPWKNFDIPAALKSLGAPVWVENDANLAGLAETRALKEQPALSLYVTISTGIGTGIIVDGKINLALSGSESGHMLLDYDGRRREWESFASGRAIKRTYDSYARDINDEKTWRQIADKIARGFYTLIPTLQPDVIIIGGSIGTYFDRFVPTLQRLLRDHLRDEIPLPEIRQAIHPEEAVIYGCYYYGSSHAET